MPGGAWAWLEVLGVFLRLGCTSFGGPVAHLGYYRRELVERRRWLTEPAYADVLALCQFLPGPASSQLGMSIGLLRAGVPGALAAWVGFTLPSALLMIGFAYAVQSLGDLQHAAWLHGLKIAALVVVAQAVWSMGRSLCPDRERAALAAGAAVLALALPTAWSQIVAIVAAGVAGWLLLPAREAAALAPLGVRLPRGLALGSAGLFVALLLGLPLLALRSSSQALRLLDSFYRTGSLVFGGGHVVLPLLQAQVVPPGWLSNDAFLAGYGAAQAVPGPLFSFAAYLGAASRLAPNGWAGGLLCVTAIFAPSFLLVFATLPFWDALRQRAGLRSAVAGVNAGVVGLLGAALYTPVWTSAIASGLDFALAVVGFVLLQFWRLPPWALVGLCAAAAWAVGG